TSISILKAYFGLKLYVLCEKMYIRYFKTVQQLLGNNIFIKKEHINKFLTNYISNKEVVNQYNITYHQLNFLINYHNIEQIDLHVRLKFYERKEIVEMFNKDDTWLYLGEKEKFYSLKQTLQLL